jgi:iron-sulfur cluster repair protein YtfE (RIC family)
MKRHEALAPLSREHHSTLILAQLLKKGAPVYKGLPDTDDAKAAYAEQQFKENIKKHFQDEERVLQKVKNCSEAISSLSMEIINEHRQLAELFLSLNKTTGLADVLDKLGRMLEAHIRKEERVLFPLIQEHCSKEELQQVQVLLH